MSSPRGRGYSVKLENETTKKWTGEFLLPTGLPAFWGPTISRIKCTVSLPKMMFPCKQLEKGIDRAGAHKGLAWNKRAKIKIQTQKSTQQHKTKEVNGKQREVPGLAAPTESRPGALGRDQAAPLSLHLCHRQTSIRCPALLSSLQDTSFSPPNSALPEKASA